MAAPLSQKEYLKRYLSGGGDDDKKKKKKKKKDKTSSSVRTKGMRIIEDSLDLRNVPFGYAEEDDNPTIAEVTYEDENMKVLEEFQVSKKWKKLEDDKQNDVKGIHRMVDSHYQKHDSDSSPPRKQKSKMNTLPPKQQRHNDSRASPPRRQRHVSDASPPRRQRHDSDDSPPRRKRHDSDDSPPRHQRHDSDAPPPRRQRHDSDASPPRQQRHDSDASPPRRQRHDSDASPSRQQRHDSDASPPRRQRHDSDASPPRRQRHDSDASPPRRQRRDSDASPPRRKRHDSDASPPRRSGDTSSSAASLKEEGKQRPERSMTTQEYLLARKRGKLKKDSPEDLLRKEREKKLQLQAEEKHQQWKHGVKQVQQYRQKLADDVHEMGKAFARTADDVDLNSKLKEKVRHDDPMLEYMKKKVDKGSNQPLKPLYQGSFPPNRLNIRPGYRWDGVDRSNGFEQKWFERQSNKRAHAEDAYKWSVSDM